MKLTKRALKNLIKEVFGEEFGEKEVSESNVEFLDRQAWKQAKGIRAENTTDKDHEALTTAFPDKNIVDPFDVNQIRKATQDASERDIIPLGRVENEVWFKTGDNKYGKLTLAQEEEELTLRGF